MGLKATPEVGIQFGAGGDTSAAELEAEGTRDPEWAIMSVWGRIVSIGSSRQSPVVNRQSSIACPTGTG
jgi:hypothetical protein